MKRYRIEPPQAPKKRGRIPFTEEEREARELIEEALFEVEYARDQLRLANEYAAEVVKFAGARTRDRRRTPTPHRIREDYLRFRAAGGSTGEDYHLWRRGRFIPKPGAQLKLVSNVEVLPLRTVKRTTYEGPDHAA